MTSALLETRGLSRAFGGLKAVDDINLHVAPCEIHAIIGPNGAGKSTMVNLLSGELKPSSGQILFEGRDITGLPPNHISHLGIGRSFQRTNIFPSMTSLENCWLAAQSRWKNSFRFLRRCEHYDDVRQAAEHALAACGLAHQRDTPARTLSYGEQRQLEIGMVLATRPRFLLLDEPMAGMGKEESGRVVELLRALAQDYALVLVEHDMDAVFSLAHRLTVMVNGRMIASGPLADVRDDPAVQQAYLGDGTEDY